MKFNRILVIFVGFLGLNAEAATQITLNSEAGDIIGQGQALYSFNDTADIIALETKRAYLEAVIKSTSGNFTLAFSPPDEQLFSAAYYPNAKRPAPPAIHPGMLVTEETRGCNEVSGYFIVHEYDFSDEAAPKIALDFKQYCAGASAALNGTIRINSDIATAYNPPIAYAGKDVIVKEGNATTLDGSASFRVDGTPIVAYQWSQISGPDVLDGVTIDTATLDITTPSGLALGGSELVFELQVTDQAGGTASDRVSVFALSKSDPVTLVTLNSPPGDYIGEGGSWTLDTTNAIISASRNGSNGVQIEIRGNDLWVANFAAANGAELATTDSPYASPERFPDHSANAPGMHITRNGRECISVTGSFVINQIQWNGDILENFWATFNQDCNGSGTPLDGEIMFKARDPLIPVIKTDASLVVNEGTRVTLDGSLSFDNGGSITRYLWQQVGQGTPVALNRQAFAIANFDAHTLPDGVRREFLTFLFEVEDADGYLAQQEVMVEIKQNNAPPITAEERVTMTSRDTITINVLANDSDSDGTLQVDSLRIFNKPPNGTAKLNGDGTIDYTPREDLDLKELKERAAKENNPELIRAQDRFSYTVRDNDGQKSELGWVVVYLDEIPLEGESDAEDKDKNTDKSPEQGAGASGRLTFALLFLAILFRCTAPRLQRQMHLIHRGQRR